MVTMGELLITGEVVPLVQNTTVAALTVENLETDYLLRHQKVIYLWHIYNYIHVGGWLGLKLSWCIMDILFGSTHDNPFGGRGELSIVSK